ncbi:MAG: ComEC/Rec2 family competence protein [Treponema sp.]|nr:ComEC/Rec2 family competence protein [Treponema sp.]
MAVNYFRKPVFISALICCFVFYSGLFVLPQKYPMRSLVGSEKTGAQIVEISGNLITSPARMGTGSYYSATLALDCVADARNISSSARGRVKVYIPSALAEAYSPGKLFSEARRARKTFVEKNNALSSRETAVPLFESGGHYVFRGKLTKNGFYIATCTGSHWKNTPRGRLSHFRALCRLHFKRLMYSWGSGGGLLLALLSGTKEYTNQETAKAFRLAGLSHILALSGMHLSMFSAIAFFFGNKAGVKKVSFFLRISALLLFVWFAGFSPSLIRAFICSILMIASSIAGVKTPDMLCILCFSFLLQSAVFPDDIYNQAFIFSYSALAGILVFGRFFNFIYAKLFPYQISRALSSATGAQTFTAPISLKLFGSASPVGILSSTVISPFITCFIYTGLALIILSLIFPVMAKPSGIFINLQYTVINYIVKFFSLAPNWSLT